ncbi:MAG: RNA-directed DNA polymerase [Nocardioidaceae bacterium]|nr:RNA-directed DNA polymerase [Nocardioidaceae bacterium]
MTPSTATTLVTSEMLAEDLKTTWVPDVLGNIDLDLLLNKPLSFVDSWGVLERLEVPRSAGGPLAVTLLGGQVHGELHRTVEGVRKAIDGLLAPGVCGYRRGAEIGFSYSSENLRFQEFSEAEAETGWVALADVRRFFDHCTWDVVLRALDRLDMPAGVDRVRRFAEAAQRSGLRTLPAGYADARLLANAVLAEADAAVELPFARWVDDYRLFAASKAEALAGLESLRAALMAIGLDLNESKVAVMSARDFGAMSGLPLASVYHPDAESPRQVRAALRTAFLHAVQSVATNRRELRFVLPRLAAQGDDIALEWVMRNLRAMPWEAPRCAAYLLAFGDRPVVQQFVEQTLLDTAETSPWFAARFAALACHTGISDHNADAIACAAVKTTSAAVEGLILRALAVSRHGRLVADLTNETVRDARAALASRREVGLPDGPAADCVPEETLAAMAVQPTPLPVVASIL